MKKVTLVFCLTAIGFISFAQVTDLEKSLKKQNTDTISGWKTGGVFGLTFSQVSLVNWASGGVNSISINGITNLFANYKKNKLSWENALDMGYGLVRQGSKTALWIKSDDKFDFASKLGSQLKNNLYFAMLYGFRTQFSTGYEGVEKTTIISDVLAPAYSLFAIGLDYRKESNFSVFLALVTLKTTIVENQNLANNGAFGVQTATYNSSGELVVKGKNIRNELGGYLKLQYRKEIVKNVSLDTKIALFSNYLHNPQNIDVNWQTAIAMKINKYLSANFTTQLIYDDDITIFVDNNNDGVVDVAGPRLQFKEVFGVGISLKF